MKKDIRPSIVLIASVLAAFLAPFLSAALNIALPAIGRDFSIDAVLLGWTATSYILAAAVFLIPFGKIADIGGRKRIFLAGAVLNALSSGLCAAAGSAGVLIAARVLQGVGAAMIFCTGVAILTAAYPPHLRGRVLGINVAFTYTGLSMGPVLGGILTQQLGWRSIFAVSGLLSLILVLVAVRLPDDRKKAEGPAFDTAGSVLLGASLVAMMLGFSRLPRAEGAVLLLAAAAGMAGFLAWERRAASPVLDLSLFRGRPVFAFSNLAALIHYCATSAAGFLLSLYLQYLKGLTPQQAGLILIAQPAVMALFSPLAGRLSDRIEPRLLASAGMSISAAGLFSLAFLSASTAVVFVGGVLVVLGAGFALFSSPNTNAVMSAVGPKDYGLASAMLGTMRLTGQMLSMAAAMLLFVLFIGRIAITPPVYGRFLSAARTGFFLFGLLCVGGIFASLARGRMHGRAGD
ncbi:MAG: MFS transporter [Candidatus Aminicenantes bacterium]|nr:MFS transporter [Candidatus Aminicenantes bacterium]